MPGRRSHVEMMRIWLCRSRNAPLSIKLHGPFLPKRFDVPSPHPLVDMLTQYAERWEVVDFDLPPFLLRQILPAKIDLLLASAILLLIRQVIAR
jgi:hypothetical protein